MHLFEIIILGNPVPWMAHAGFGRRSFNPRYKEREAFQYLIKKDFKDEPFEGPIKLDIWFHMPIPKGTSKKRISQMETRDIYHLKRPDVTNLVKMIEDCLKGIVFKDDSQVVEIVARKCYSLNPKTVISVLNLNGDEYGRHAT